MKSRTSVRSFPLILSISVADQSIMCQGETTQISTTGRVHVLPQLPALQRGVWSDAGGWKSSRKPGAGVRFLIALSCSSDSSL